DAGQRDGAPGAPGPRVGHPDPAARVLVPLAVAVPVELYLDPTVLVRPDLLTGWSHHHGAVKSVDSRVGSEARGAELLPARRRQRGERGVIARGLPGRALVRVVEEVPVSADDEVL